VLLLGPLYHLTARADRLRALAEARRVARSGGVVAVAVISRYASTFDGFFRGFIDKPGFAALMAEDLRTGQHRNPGHDAEFFTTAYFHDCDGIADEITESGLRLRHLLPVEGPMHWAPGAGVVQEVMHLAHAGHILPETIEFSVSRSAEERMPFVRGKPENRAFRVLAVTNTDHSVRQARHLDAVAVGETQGALDPVRG
jgi:hypothetical protein